MAPNAHLSFSAITCRVTDIIERDSFVYWTSKLATHLDRRTLLSGLISAPTFSAVSCSAISLLGLSTTATYGQGRIGHRVLFDSIKSIDEINSWLSKATRFSAERDPASPVYPVPDSLTSLNFDVRFTEISRTVEMFDPHRPVFSELPQDIDLTDLDHDETRRLISHEVTKFSRCVFEEFNAIYTLETMHRLATALQRSSIMFQSLHMALLDASSRIPHYEYAKVLGLIGLDAYNLSHDFSKLQVNVEQKYLVARNIADDRLKLIAAARLTLIRMLVYEESRISIEALEIRATLEDLAAKGDILEKWEMQIRKVEGHLTRFPEYLEGKRRRLYGVLNRIARAESNILSARKEKRILESKLKLIKSSWSTQPHKYCPNRAQFDECDHHSLKERYYFTPQKKVRELQSKISGLERDVRQLLSMKRYQEEQISRDEAEFRKLSRDFKVEREKFRLASNDLKQRNDDVAKRMFGSRSTVYLDANVRDKELIESQFSRLKARLK